MAQQKMSENQSKDRDQKTVRGEDLREKMIESQEKGEEFRSEHQGTDQRAPVKNHG